jgi:hypothetical protein
MKWLKVLHKESFIRAEADQFESIPFHFSEAIQAEIGAERSGATVKTNSKLGVHRKETRRAG